jgi:hypothetical protein
LFRKGGPVGERLRLPEVGEHNAPDDPVGTPCVCTAGLHGVTNALVQGIQRPRAERDLALALRRSASDDLWSGRAA